MFRRLLGDRQAGSSSSLDALDEPKALEEAMYAATFIINDDMETAELELAKGNSAFHKLGQALVTFLRATLGFEREVMKEASDRVSTAEASAGECYTRAQKNPKLSASSIYTAGQEYALCQAESRIMGAVLGVLTESVTESIKGFYKLRQAYLALEVITTEEKKYLDSIGHAPVSEATNSTSSLDSSAESMPEDSEDEFFDVKEAEVLASSTTPKYQGHLSTELKQDHLSQDVDNLTIKEPIRRMSSALPEGPGRDIFGDNPVDAFIHSGSNMCYGIILILIAMLPPAFSTLSRIAGFKGDRARGLAMLWQATKFQNMNGSFAGLVLLGYYNGFTGFCDILAQHGKDAYPKKKCQALLTSFRARYPKSRLWMLEEARMLSSRGNLEQAVELLNTTDECQMKQLLALQWFEKSLTSMYMGNYEDCSIGFQKCVTLNNWSHALYYYIAGSAQVELYREFRGKDEAKSLNAKIKAEELLKKVPDHVGKRKIMGRQLPFDVFVSRKILKWEHRAKERKIDFIDAIGVSPIQEMSYFWNGFKRMRPDHLEKSLSALAWSTSEANPYWSKESLDERAILAVLQGTVLRNLGRRQEARDIMAKEVIAFEWQEFKGGLKDNWTCPVAHYETAVSHWNDYCETEDKKDLKQSSFWLEKVAAWESYDLDARVGMRVKTGLETVKKEDEATG